MLSAVFDVLANACKPVREVVVCIVGWCFWDCAVLPMLLCCGLGQVRMWWCAALWWLRLCSVPPWGGGHHVPLAPYPSFRWSLCSPTRCLAALIFVGALLVSVGGFGGAKRLCRFATPAVRLVPDPSERGDGGSFKSAQVSNLS